MRMVATVAAAPENVHIAVCSGVRCEDVMVWNDDDPLWIPHLRSNRRPTLRTAHLHPRRKSGCASSGRCYRTRKETCQGPTCLGISKVQTATDACVPVRHLCILAKLSLEDAECARPAYIMCQQLVDVRPDVVARTDLAIAAVCCQDLLCHGHGVFHLQLWSCRWK
jgi:hypothetical protein